MTYPEMKSSDVQWIGDIPSHWNVSKAKYHVVITNGSDPETEGDIPVYGSGAGSFKTCGKYKEGPAVLIGRKGATLHIPHFIEGRYWNADTAFDVKARKGYNLRYFYYSACCFDYKYYISQTTLPSMTQSNYANMKIPAPPIQEQNNIAAFLDAKCGGIDAIIDEAKTSIEEYRRWKASVIYQAVTKGLNPDAPMKDSGVSWIGEIPATWDTCAIKRFSTKIGSGKTPSGGAEVYSDTGVIFLRSQNVYNEGLRLSDVSHISPEIDDSMSNTRVRYNDVLLNITGGSMGRCCLFDLTDTQANVNQHVCIIRTVAEMVRPEFLRYFWISESGPMAIGQYQTGGNRPGLNFEQIGNTKIPLCSPDEQDGIIRYLDRRCKAIDNLIEEKQSLIAELEAYKKSLIYEAVTGKRKVG